jgi:hypothetical protein
MATSLYLDPTTWDLTVDASGNIAVASDPYALAQNAATACRTFLGEVWYNQATGVPYWQDILGHFPALSIVKADLVAAAETVAGVASAQAFITGVVNRQLAGQIQVTDNSGNVSAASF